MATPLRLSFLSINARGLNQARKRRQVFRWAHNSKADIIFLQETYSTESVEEIWRSEWGGKIHYSHGSRHSRGVMILFNPKLDFQVDNTIADKNGRYLMLEIIIHDSTFLLCNVYAPNDNSSQNTFFSNLNNTLKQHTNLQIILGGDLNCALTPLDKTGGTSIEKKKSVIREINSLCSNHKLQDVWRSQHPNLSQFTWRNHSLKIQCRLDYWLVSKNLSSSLLKTDITSPTFSDHSAISFVLQSEEYTKRGPGFWKINNSLLKDDKFTSELKAKIPEFKAKHNYLEDKGLYWDMLKMEVRGFCVQYSKRENKFRRNAEKELQNKIDHLMNVLKTNRSRENIIELYRLRAELNKITEYRTKGAIVRSRIRWHEEGERNTKYFLNLEKRQHSKTHITKLKHDGREITDPDEILRSQRLFYKNLYTASPCDATQNDIFFLNANLPKLDKPEQDKLENPLRSEECYNVLKECAKGKCPGSDGLSVEFYLHFWSLLGEEMTQSFNYAFQRGQMNITQKQGIIKVIPKKKKDKSYLENWRPLTLLNVDYKIATKTMAHRIATVLPKLINEDQTGYVKGRYIGQNIRLIQDIMKVTESENIPGIALFIDFKKAFDTLDWNFVFKTLEAFNFGPEIQQWIKTFYTNCSSCVMNNGYASEFFKIERGVRQGCPLSGALFVLCAEILANAIRQDKTINGIIVFDKEFKVSQYADDTTAFVADLQSAENLFKLLHAFQKCSGLEINTTKTEGMWLGANRNKKTKHFDIAWPSEPVFALGIHFTYSDEVSHQKNFEQKLTSMKNLLNIWYPRNLSLYGRITILKTLALSKLIYNTSMLSFPHSFVKTVNQTIKSFIWRKTAKIKHTAMIGPKEKGGLNMPDFDIINNSLKVTWIKRLNDSPHNASWSHIPLAYLNNVGGRFLFECNYEMKSLKVNIPLNFYKEALEAWQKLTVSTPESKEQILEEIIWNNRFITIDGSSVYYKQWHEAGVTKIGDIFKEDSFLTFNDFASTFQIKTNFLKYYGLCHAIPKKWINHLKGKGELITNSLIHGTTKLSLNKISCKVASQMFVKMKSEKPTAEKRMTQANFDEETIRLTYSIPFKVTKDIRLTILQFKIIHHILPTNATLFRDSLIQHEKCHLCNEKQTLIHLFVTCSFVQTFWTQFALWWNRKHSDSITLSEQNIIYGFTQDLPRRLGLNLCLIIAKYYIYTASRREEDYIWEAFFAILKSHLEIEKHKSKSQISI